MIRRNRFATRTGYGVPQYYCGLPACACLVAGGNLKLVEAESAGCGLRTALRADADWAAFPLPTSQYCSPRWQVRRAVYDEAVHLNN
jgi:hypothetical protein